MIVCWHFCLYEAESKWPWVRASSCLLSMPKLTSQYQGWKTGARRMVLRTTSVNCSSFMFFPPAKGRAEKAVPGLGLNYFQLLFWSKLTKMSRPKYAARSETTWPICGDSGPQCELAIGNCHGRRGTVVDVISACSKFHRKSEWVAESNFQTFLLNRICNIKCFWPWAKYHLMIMIRLNDHDDGAFLGCVWSSRVSSPGKVCFQAALLKPT